ncbi:MAG TPA: cupredoxin family copper-binding protein [Chloroflexota bacterium]|jgi:plastocyanin
MLSLIDWRQTALAAGALVTAGTLWLTITTPLARATPPAPAATSPATHAAMSAAAHASMLADRAQERAPERLAPSAAPAVVSADAAVIDIDAFQFSAPTLTVAAGTTVTWTNHDVEPHTVTANDRAFGSAGLETDDTFAFLFDKPGTYAYHCALHPFMTGQIVVQ